MNKSNIAKVIIAILLIAVVAVATFNYGTSQRKKLSSPTDTAKSSLPTVKDSSNAGSANNDTQGVDTPSNPPVSAQIPTKSIPATGPSDNIVAVLVLGGLTGMYLVSRRKLKQRV